MNIEKIFKILDSDEMNSALGIICTEIESQGYKIEIEGIEVSANEIFNNKIPSLEEVNMPLNIKLIKNGKLEQKFSLAFVDYHTVSFNKYIEK